MSPNRKGILFISFEDLEKALGIPSDHKIEGVFQDIDRDRHLRVKVSGPNCPDILKGEIIRWIQLSDLYLRQSMNRPSIAPFDPEKLDFFDLDDGAVKEYKVRMIVVYKIESIQIKVSSLSKTKPTPEQIKLISESGKGHHAWIKRGGIDGKKDNLRMAAAETWDQIAGEIQNKGYIEHHLDLYPEDFGCDYYTDEDGNVTRLVDGRPHEVVARLTFHLVNPVQISSRMDDPLTIESDQWNFWRSPIRGRFLG